MQKYIFKTPIGYNLASCETLLQEFSTVFCKQATVIFLSHSLYYRITRRDVGEWIFNNYHIPSVLWETNLINCIKVSDGYNEIYASLTDD